MENQVMKPYRIAITETYVKEVEIYAPDEYTAMQHAEDLCAEGIINLDYDNFIDRNTECRGISRDSDLQLHEVFEAEEGVKAQRILEYMIYPTFLAGNAVYIDDDIKITMGDDGQLYCRFKGENTARPLRDNIAEIKEGDAFFCYEHGLICITYDNACHDETDEHEWIVYGDDGEVYYEEDIGKDIYKLYELCGKEWKIP